jgi:hypothetical protein
VVHAEFHVQIVRPAGEQFDQAGRRVLGEERGSRQPQQPATSAGLADLLDRAVLQAEQFGRATGQSQPTRGERQPGRSTGEEPVAQLLAQVPDVQRDSRFGYAQFPSGLLDRPKPDHRRERTLSRSHNPVIVRLAGPAATEGEEADGQQRGKSGHDASGASQASPPDSSSIRPPEPAPRASAAASTTARTGCSCWSTATTNKPTL